MNDPTLPSQDGAGLGLLLLSGLAIWCWIGRGPRPLRWFGLIAILLLILAHLSGGQPGSALAELAAPLLALFIVCLGFMCILRGFGWRPRPRYYRYGRRGYDDRW